jgi:hypothetical protein
MNLSALQVVVCTTYEKRGYAYVLNASFAKSNDMNTATQPK